MCKLNEKKYTSTTWQQNLCYSTGSLKSKNNYNFDSLKQVLNVKLVSKDTNFNWIGKIAGWILFGGPFCN